MNYIFILLLLLTNTLISYGQIDQSKTVADWNPKTYSEGDLYPGYIIKLDGDTVKGYIKAKSRCNLGSLGSSNQNIVEFYTREADRKPSAKFKPSELKEYMIADKKYESLKYSGGLFNKPNFNIIVNDGAIRIYEWYRTVDSFFTIKQQSNESWYDYYARIYETKLVIAKNPNEPVEFGMMGLFFTKHLVPMISDYPELASKVKNKQKGYTALHIFDIIDEYNRWAATNK